MQKKLLLICMFLLLILQPLAIAASNSMEAKQEWKDFKEISLEKRQANNEAKTAYQGNKSAENEQEVIDTGKEVLYAALDEAEAWLIWKNFEVEENDEMPDDLAHAIEADVETNLAKIDGLRAEVEDIDNRLELGVVTLRMVGKYFELLTDVSRNSGKVWVYIADKRADKLEEYEEKLRTAAEDIEDNTEILERLDTAKSEIAQARENIDAAEAAYENVQMPGTPLIKFAEGNKHLRDAKLNMLNAHTNLRQAFRVILEEVR